MSLLRRRSSLLLALVLSACGGSAPPAESPSEKAPPSAPTASATVSATPSAAAVTPAPAPSSTAPASEDPPLPTPSAPVVKLVDPGAEPRQPLRYAFSKKPETIQMDMRMAMALTMGDVARPKTTMPTIRIRSEIKPVSVDKDGTLTATVETKSVDVLSDAPLPKEIQDKLKKEMSGIVGLKGRTVVTSRGEAKEASIDVPKDAPPQAKKIVESLKDSLRDLSLPFPAEPVGKNAKWEVKSVVATQLTTAQTTTYVIKELSGKALGLDVTLVQEAPPQKLETPPGLPAGATIHVDSHKANGAGSVKIALDRLTPTSTMKLSARSQTTVTLGSEKQSAVSELEMDLAVKPAGK